VVVAGEGFDSPGFAAYMLEQFSLLSAPAAECVITCASIATHQPTIHRDVVFYTWLYHVLLRG